ncbi:MAG: nucleotidyltransferase [Gemmataceae bacterium]|nr:nucleotidyltransferase [Gemmataceae bacterium]
MAALVAHMDADAFYVSAERVRRHTLRGKPVAVLGNQGACVIAKSYEMKGCGVKTGEPIWEAVKKCPEGVFLKRDFRWYEVLSRDMLDALASFSHKIEYYSIDEFFFHVAPASSAAVDAFAREVRDTIGKKVGVPVTVGIARTRSLAKLISDTAKPCGASAVVGPERERELLARLPVTEITGIASRRAARLAPYGIRTCLDFTRAPGHLIRQLLTVAGHDLWRELNGHQIQPINTARIPHKTLSRGGSLGGAVAQPSLLWAWAVRNLERLIEELEFHAVKPARLTVELSHRDGSGTQGDAPLEIPTDRFDELLDAIRVGMRHAWRPGVPVSHMHLTASELRRARGQQLSLFRLPSPKAAAIATLKREVNARFGRFALRSGATLPLTSIYADPSNDYDICDVRGKSCF